MDIHLPTHCYLFAFYQRISSFKSRSGGVSDKSQHEELTLIRRTMEGDDLNS